MRFGYLEAGFVGVLVGAGPEFPRLTQNDDLLEQEDVSAHFLTSFTHEELIL